MTYSPPIIRIFGFRVQNTSIRKAAETILDRAESGIRKNVYFLNAHCVNIAAKDPGYREVLSRADCVFGDGVGIAMATRFAGQALQDNVNGTDLFPVLCELAAEREVPIALIGAKDDIVDRCAKRMMERYPGLNIVWTHPGYFDRDEEEEVLASINQSGAKLLLVARGVPRQELWIDKLGDRLEIPQVMAVGALFDFYSGHVFRAPLFMRQLGLEWLVRFAQEPRRLFKRYMFGNPLFVYRTLRLRFQGVASLREKLG